MTQNWLYGFVLLLGGLAWGQEPAPIITRLEHITIFVRDYDEALRWYTEVLGFAKMEDQTFGKSQRWLTVAPSNQKETHIVLAKADDQRADMIGKQSLWVFRTEDCQRAYQTLQARGVKFRAPPRKAPWGSQAIFEDLYGNEFVLLGAR
jgi:predicted enzyme related to lactoylglutathione lyase